ncbi:MAG: methyltransferase domain-containing protein [Nitrospiraceae bacterium]|nr:MAG: methyltransferase domain-containing protein [Nitrospiraceae bacterium]
MKKEETTKIVREGYAKVARQGSSCCAPSDTCCGSTVKAEDISKVVGYSEEELASVPDAANMGLGCGNPVAIASLKEGETVIDLGSGGGLDCFLAAAKVGISGRVIGIDMTPEMLEKARENARRGNYVNVEFRLGEIENLPVADNTGNVIISNCVINLSPDKKRVFSEAFRVLKPGGRIMISDIALKKDLPDFLKDSIDAYISCLSGAIKKDEYLSAVRDAGFQDVEIIEERVFSLDCYSDDPIAKAVLDNSKITLEQLRDVADTIVSIKVSGVKTC